MFLYKTVIGFLLSVSLVTAGCAQTARNTPPIPPTAPARAGGLTPYASPSPSATVTPNDPSTATPLPSATPTPLTHVVVKGEDMSGVALRYGIELAELLAANPTVNPRFMSIGTVLVIPSSRDATPTAPPTGGDVPLQTPTPVAVETGRVACTPAADGGMWCFQPVRNRQSYPIEGLTALFQVTGSQGKPVLSQTASLPLDLLPPGAALPLAAYFPPDPSAPLPEPAIVTSQLTSALPNRDDGRYLRCHTENEKVMISPDGLSAEISLDVVIDQADSRARRIWVAATAYDRGGSVIGVRRWEKPDEEPVATGESQPVTMYLYSVAGEIDRVELTAESRP